MDINQEINQPTMLPPPPPPPGMLLGGPPNWPPGQGPTLMGPPSGPPPQSLLGPPPGTKLGPPGGLLTGPNLEDPNQAPPMLMSLNVGGPVLAEQDQANKKPSELVLPKALEDALALKTLRARELGAEEALATTGAVVPVIPTPMAPPPPSGVMSSYLDMDGDSDDEQMDGMVPPPPVISKAEGRLDRNRRRKQRKKENRKARREQNAAVLLQREKDKEEAGTKPVPERATVEIQDKEQEPEAEENDNPAEKTENESPPDPEKQNGDKPTSDSTDEDTGNDEKSKTKISDSQKAMEKSIRKINQINDSITMMTEALGDVEIEYVPEKITIADLAPMYRQFYRVFEIFKLETKLKETAKVENADLEKAAAAKKAAEKDDDDDDDDDDEDAMDEGEKDDKERISKRKMKKLTRLSVAELKQLVARPDVVEMHDVTARDPKLLIQLKSHRNTVQVPRHWCFKRKYLQGKRGIEKPPFELPAFIKKTGIMEMRASLQEKDESKTLKAKMRERARPKMGKIDIDYQKLHDAFFKWQTKPRMTIHGDLYYEGKEFETRLKEKKPGDLSEELRVALGMPIGPACHKIPPPWLIAQQRYGPPPSYPNLRIPGLNAPIPEGCSFGYHAGGWGKPPVDENGKPLYGDVFGMSASEFDNGIGEEEIDRTQWGELESESEESSEEEEEDGEDLGAPPDESGLITPAEGLVTPSGLTSGVPAGMETPDTIELRKKKIESEMEDNETPVLYQILQERRGDRIGAAMMGSTHVYEMPSAAAAAAGGSRAARGGPIDREGMVELALDPSELDMDNEAMAQRYEQQMREQQSHLQKEDLSDMLAEHVARQKSKRKRQQTDTTSKQTKKYKEFKF
ncbi:splicing factor 3B subunit 2 isoform X2 [Uranotaenia lowii]|uniref:splicing factor 3B subunit 2 isoform X2 n=1 Tax=Uranotaenia lowii TaxID=190385 RepID=UPI002478E58B|nr:splicing factor 3B subunit 2 isoform X2 [Uranotaenia lowii]